MGQSSKALILRSERSERLEGWATDAVRVPILRDAPLRDAPQDEVVVLARLATVEVV
jgi:hypothetical protein